MVMQLTPDQINAAFEFVGSLLLCLSIYRLYRDRVVRGVSAVPVTFFATWGYWNLYFYPSMGAWWSFWAGILMVSVNTTWLLQMAYYVGGEWYAGKRKLSGGTT